MAVPLLAAVDITATVESGLTTTQLSYINNVYVDASESNYDTVLNYIVKNASQFQISVNVPSLQKEEIISLLDAGAARVFTSYDQLQALKGTVDDSRLVLILEAAHQSREKIVDAISDTSVGVYAHKVTDMDFIFGWLQEYGSNDRPPVYVSFVSAPKLEDVVTIGKLSATPIVSNTLLTMDPAKDTSLLPVAEIFMAGVVSDRPDKLIATVVTDEQGVALGLVYSSNESVKESLRTGTGVYQSRKRGLWYKGATSGAVQELVRIDADCDQDCLRFVVRQKGTGE